MLSWKLTWEPKIFDIAKTKLIATYHFEFQTHWQTLRLSPLPITKFSKGIIVQNQFPEQQFGFPCKQDNGPKCSKLLGNLEKLLEIHTLPRRHAKVMSKFCCWPQLAHSYLKMHAAHDWLSTFQLQMWKNQSIISGNTHVIYVCMKTITCFPYCENE